MKINDVLKEQISIVSPTKEELEFLNNNSGKIISELERELKSVRGSPEIFIGGSFAKNTLIKKQKYDVDILVRFDWKFDNISDMLEAAVKRACKNLKLKYDRIHGSRDYFRIYLKENSYFEIIPVTKIKKPSEERNVTDLTYFHVPYVRRKIKGLENDIKLMKHFMQANKVYGAETYIRGFSGYSVELLIIYYGGFLKMLRELSKVKRGERVIIDIEKKYKRKNDVLFDMNENKLQSPIILVDPTYKERNALAALSRETFEKFQQRAREFLKRPSSSFFEEKKIDFSSAEKEAKKKKAQFLRIKLKTSKQAGDIAGTKLKKFYYLIEREIQRYFNLLKHEFEYYGNQEAEFYMILKSKGEVIRIGPPLHLKKQVNRFKKQHVNTYEKGKLVHAKIKVNFTAKNYLDVWKKDKHNKKMMKDMGITEMRIR